MASSIKRRRQCAAPVPKTRASRAKKDPNDKSAKKGNSAFCRICVLSDELTNFFDGKRYLRRSDVVKGMWAYFKENDLMDPKDRRMVLLDDKLKTVFGLSCKRIMVLIK